MIALLEPNVNTPDDEEVLLGLAPEPPKLNVEAPVAGAGAAASSIAVYGAYGDVIAAFINSLLGKS